MIAHFRFASVGQSPPLRYSAASAQTPPRSTTNVRPGCCRPRTHPPGRLPHRRAGPVPGSDRPEQCFKLLYGYLQVDQRLAAVRLARAVQRATERCSNVFIKTHATHVAQCAITKWASAKGNGGEALEHGELQTSTYAPGLPNCRPYCLDEASHRPVLRITSRSTHELVAQLPAEEVLRLLEQLARPGSVPERDEVGNTAIWHDRRYRTKLIVSV